MPSPEGFSCKWNQLISALYVAQSFHKFAPSEPGAEQGTHVTTAIEARGPASVHTTQRRVASCITCFRARKNPHVYSSSSNGNDKEAQRDSLRPLVDKLRCA